MDFQIKLFLLCAMFFCHIVDDYYLQGILAQMKQKRWWNENTPAYTRPYMYRNDYKMALAEHAFSWSFATSIPIIVYYLLTVKNDTLWLVICFTVLNTAMHAYVDNLKANKCKINLVQDQTAHFIQILITWLCCCVLV